MSLKQMLWFVSLFLIFVVAIIFVLSLSRKIKNIPRELKIAKQKKFDFSKMRHSII